MSYFTTSALQKRNYNFYWVESAAAPPPPPAVLTGLIYPGTASDGGDIRLLWSGVNKLSRTSSTLLFRANFFNQNDYFMVGCHSPNTGNWDFGQYTVIITPYPTDGAFNPVTGATNFVSGDTHYYEIAGLGGIDAIATADPGGVPQPTLIVTKGIWVRQSFTIETDGGNLIHTHRADMENNPTFSIVQNYPLASIGAPADPAFYIGASDWRANQPTFGRNDETTNAIIRAIVQFSEPISTVDQAAILALDTDAQVLAYCAANGLTDALWYLNMNPAPDDVSDKSGNGRDPVWNGNGTIPTLWTSE